MLGLDKRAIREAHDLLSTGNLSDKHREALVDMVKWYENSRFFTSKQRDYIKDIGKESKRREEMHGVMGQLSKAMADGKVNPDAMRFVLDIQDQFERKGFLTVIQQEHIEKIIRGNNDPEDDEMKETESRLSQLTSNRRR